MDDDDGDDGDDGGDEMMAMMGMMMTMMGDDDSHDAYIIMRAVDRQPGSVNPPTHPGQCSANLVYNTSSTHSVRPRTRNHLVWRENKETRQVADLHDGGPGTKGPGLRTRDQGPDSMGAKGAETTDRGPRAKDIWTSDQ